MGRPPKHDWDSLFVEFIRDKYPSIAAFAKAKDLNKNQVSDEFRRLNGTRSKLVAEVRWKATRNERETLEQTTPERETGRQAIIEGLTDKEALFVLNFLIDCNASKAAIAAGYTKNRANQAGYELLHRPAVQAGLQKRVRNKMACLGLDADRVILEYMKIAFADVSSYLTFGQKDVPVMGAFGPVYAGKGKNRKPVMKRISYVDFRESEEIDTSLISEVKQGREGVSIKLPDKMKALEKLEKYFDLLPDNWKRMVEQEKLGIDRERLELEKSGASKSSETTADMEAAIEEAWRKRSEQNAQS